MSRIQKSTKPTLKALIAGEALTMTPEIQVQLAVWATMTTMVVEFADEKTAAIPKEERFDFFINQSPRPNWFVWMGKMEDKNAHGRYYHRALHLFPPNSKAVPNNGNAQTTVLSAGNLIIQTLSIDARHMFQPYFAFDAVIAGRAAISVGLALIWPLGSYHSVLGTVTHNERSIPRNIALLHSIVADPQTALSARLP